MARTAVGLLLAAALAAGCGGAGKPRFEPASGWHLLSRDGELAAANLPFAAADRSLSRPPSHTVATLPRDGIVIWTLLVPQARTSGGGAQPKYWPARPPLRVGVATATNPPEGFFCAPAAEARCFDAAGSVRRLQGRAGGYDVAVTIFFGTDRPSAAQVRAADGELARLSP